MKKIFSHGGRNFEFVIELYAEEGKFDSSFWHKLTVTEVGERKSICSVFVEEMYIEREITKTEQIIIEMVGNPKPTISDRLSKLGFK